MTVVENLSLEEKLTILSDAAKYDVSCTSSGVERKGKNGATGNTSAAGICHSFSADGRCISLLKILFTNECIYDCKYCLNRKSNDTLRTSFTPEEVYELTMQFYRRNYIEGLFLSSGISKNPNETMERLYRTLLLLRRKHHFNGYIHVKAIPGAAPELIEMTGFLADRMSANLELPTAAGLEEFAPNKTRKMILSPMRQIQLGIGEKNKSGIHRIGSNGQDRRLLSYKSAYTDSKKMIPAMPDKNELTVISGRTGKKNFVPAGQSTQMIVGATRENDYQILSVAQELYHKFDMKRVFYSAYVALNEESNLPAIGTKPPLLREHRLYQADWLMRFYGFEAGELLSEERPNFNLYLDPKCEWALRHLEYFPVEINQASYAMLLRVPGIGVKSAGRIIMARKSCRLTFENLKRIGVVLKRAHYFITCGGKLMYQTKIDEDYITRKILELDHRKNWELDYNMTFRQLSLFDDCSENKEIP